MDTRLLLLSASDLAELIRRRDVTSREVVEAHLERIRAVNPALNAIVRDRFETARREADRADEQVRAGAELAPFHGVPCTIKECFGWKGDPLTSGLVSRKKTIASEHATAVDRILSLGAIPLGFTNTSELCLWIEASNRLHGRTNNPYDATRTAGGSSGGEGAIVGSGGSPFGIGSDLGGSIRMPALFNGVFGHKPTGGLVPTTGQYPVPANHGRRYHGTGPLARRASDLLPILRALAGPDGRDPTCRPELELGDPAGVDLSALTVVDIEDNGSTPVSKDLRDAQRRVVAHLGRTCTVKRVRLEALRHSVDMWGALVLEAGGPPFREMLGHRNIFRSLFEFLPWAARRSPHTLPALILAVIERSPLLLAGYSKRFTALARELKEELASLLGPRGVLIYPSYSSAAPRHMMAMFPPFNWVYTGILNVLEMPATQVPLGLGPEGLPLGVQVAACAGGDHLTIAVALELERAFGGWVPPFPLQGGSRELVASSAYEEARAPRGPSSPRRLDLTRR